MSPEEYHQLHRDAQENHEEFWAKRAQKLTWREPFLKTLQWEIPFAKWFLGGRINATENCVDRHLLTDRKHKKAIIWEGERGETRTLTYQELHEKIAGFSDLLLVSGIRAGDCVAIYMPLVPEAVVAMLACARIGATHNVIFGGFSSEGLRDRIADSSCKAVITADGGFRKGAVVELKQVVDKALENNACPSVKHVFVFKHAGNPIVMTPGRDIEWILAPAQNDRAPKGFASEHPLFVLYTSGTTGKPKGIVHGTGGYLTQVASSFEWVFAPQESDIYWCTADIGWVTGHSYGVYGPLSAGATIFMYEGAPLFPEPDRFWKMIARHGVTILYSAPTAIRMFMQQGDDWVKKHDLSSLRLLGSVGEPINPEAWHWYSRMIGGGRCPIVDTWWQTETGAIMISPVPGVTELKPGSATRPLPGICAEVENGFLVVKKPWPSMTLGILGDPERFKQTYWSQIPGAYFTGDGVVQDKDGDFWISGRVDDVLKIAGHRLGTAEIESAVANHASVAECAVVGKPDDIKGQVAVAFVLLKEGELPSPELEKSIGRCVSESLGSFARPSEIRFVSKLPKTRSGKIMRRILRDVVIFGKVSGDMSTLEDGYSP
ncbi:MAG: acetate--CoA ligase [Myxococcaceae bacterium]